MASSGIQQQQQDALKLLSTTTTASTSSVTAATSNAHSTSPTLSTASDQLQKELIASIVNSISAPNSANLISSGANKDHRSRSRSSSLAGIMFSEVFEAKAVDIDSGALEDNANGTMNEGKDKICKLCNSRLVAPRVLSCLHVFCEECLTKLISEDEVSSLVNGGGDGQSSVARNVIKCQTCNQETKLGQRGIDSLICDYIQTNILDLSSIEQMSCTSCKSKEKAISRCNDCANFLCFGCDNAHKYMRCFENHEVVKLEDLRKSDGADKPLTVHKPLFCSVHATEHLKYYCFSCQMTVCNDCLIADHKGTEHHYESIQLAEKAVRTDVENLIKEAKTKVQYCDSAATTLTSALNELQTQHDSARDLIEDTYKNFIKVLEKCRDQALADLGKLHSERELKIMDVLQNIETITGRIDETCKFANRVLDEGNAVEFLSMQKLITTQIMNLINNTPKSDTSYSLNFDTKMDKFEVVIREAFGKFRTESSPPSPKESTPPPTLPGVAPSCDNLNNSGNSHGQLTSSVTASSPISMPASMQSSFEGDLSVLGGGNGFASNVLNPDAVIAQQGLGVQLQQSGATALVGGGNIAFNDIGVNNLNQILGGNARGLNGGGLSATNATNILNNSPINGGGHLGQSLNSTLNSLNVNLGSLNGSGGAVNLNNGLNAGLSGAMNGGINSTLSHNGSNGSGQPNFSYLEYNLSRLASMTDSHSDTINDSLVGPSAGSGHNHQAVVPAAAQNSTITLADIISGDQRAFNNLQALAKLGLNNNDFQTDPNDQLLTNGSLSNGLDLYPDFGLSPNAIGAVDDITLGNFHASAPPNATSILTGRNKATPMQIRCKFGSLGTSRGQFNSPHGFCLGVDEEIIVADTNNHRIEVFDKAGTLKFQFGVPGKEEGQLWYPRKVAVMPNNGKFVVCDRGNERSRMQIFSKCGHFMRKIAIRYIDIVAGLAVTSKGHIVAVDSVSPTVFVISEDGELVRWFDCSDYMREPSDIAIRENDFYVCDFKGHCVAVFQEDGTFQYRIGNEKVTCFPNGIDISNAGDILIGDSHGNRFHVACYSRDGVLQSEFECPHVKVSRCCGLKITSEGYIVTLAKNNHHVLVLNTLYVH